MRIVSMVWHAPDRFRPPVLCTRHYRAYPITAHPAFFNVHDTKNADHRFGMAAVQSFS
ncbi:MAG: hypothetical protein ACI8WM_002925 [Burkholderiaceae bacterium]|jgi:hypothetical protein